MSRIPTPATIEAAPSASQPPLPSGQEATWHRSEPVLDSCPTSPAALEGYLGLSAALGKGELPAATGEQIALAVAEINSCSYCLSAHTYLGKNVAKLDDAEMAANRQGGSNDRKADAAVRFAANVARERGHVSEDDLKAVKAAGYTSTQVIEIVQHVALNTWTNYINEVAKTDIDFPAVKVAKAA